MILENIPLRDKTWFRTGGEARFYAEPKDQQAFAQALAFAQRGQLPIFILGQGANVLISDDGFAGLVIRPQLTGLLHQHTSDTTTLVTAGAGVVFGDLITYCLDNNILGLEEFSGIPGTVGGAAFINLHFFQFLLSQFLVQGTVIHKGTGAIKTVPNEWFQFGYNQSTLQQREYYLLDATFQLKRCSQLEAAYARGRSHEIIRYRAWRYPAHNTCGSFFRNFHDNEVTLTVSNKKMIFVAYYLDAVGTKGNLQIGGARVSHQHANMLVTSDTASSSDVIAVAQEMQKRVRDKFNLIPQPECLLIGFKDYPLLTSVS